MTIENTQLEIFDLLNVNLKVFEGPLELLLDLIRKKKMDIHEIPLAEICEPYLRYLELMESFDMEIAMEFLEIASTLILIKSRALLPRDNVELDDEDEFDTEERLRQKLIEYQKYKSIAATLIQYDLLGRDLFPRPNVEDTSPAELSNLLEDVSVYGLLKAYSKVRKKLDYKKPHEVRQEEYSLEQRLLELLKILQSGDVYSFQNLCPIDPTASEIVISFLAVLELARLYLVQLHQMQQFGTIHCKPAQDINDHIPQIEAQFNV